MSASRRGTRIAAARNSPHGRPDGSTDEGPADADVAELSVHLGLRLGLRPAALPTLAEGAYLHDVGKVGIPDQILNKPGTSARRNGPGSNSTRWSGPTSSGAPSPRDALAVIRQHHERYDGSGYPDGLAGEGSRWPLASWPSPTCWTRSPPTARTASLAARPSPAAPGGQSGHPLRPHCLDAFLALMAERGHRPASGEVDPTVADAAAEACHDHPDQADLPTIPATPSQR